MKLLTFALFFSGLVYGETQVYRGEARLKGKIVYLEKHTTEISGGKVKSSVTEYTSPDGKLLAKLSNNFEKSLNAPENEMLDLSHKNKHGVRYENDKIVMYNQDDNEKEKSKLLNPRDFKNKLIVAGQGLHYYIVGNMEDIILKGKLDMRFLIPGRLDSYNFYMKMKKSSSETVEFEIEIDNWFLRMFAPKLELVYDRKKSRLLSYKGLSNIRDKDKEIMNVEITYKYQD